jgi:signal transduction histidine kinase
MAEDPKDIEFLERELEGLRKKNARLEAELSVGRQRVQVLSRRMLEVQEAERRHIARELHDEIGQALTAVKILLQGTLNLPEAEPLRGQLEESISVAERAMEQVRTLSLNLRPSLLDDLGLVSALRWYLDRQEKRTGVPIRFYAPLITARLPAEIETAFFRIVQESLTNAFRYAQAKQVQVSLSLAGKTLELLVIDDGIGFDPAQARHKALSGASLGLLGMEERARLVGGEFSLKSEVGKGTEIRVILKISD